MLVCSTFIYAGCVSNTKVSGIDVIGLLFRTLSVQGAKPARLWDWKKRRGGNQDKNWMMRFLNMDFIWTIFYGLKKNWGFAGAVLRLLLNWSYSDTTFTLGLLGVYRVGRSIVQWEPNVIQALQVCAWAALTHFWSKSHKLKHSKSGMINIKIQISITEII